jgi:hypothetical protein
MEMRSLISQTNSPTKDLEVTAANSGGEAGLSILSALLEGLRIQGFDNTPHFLASQPAANSGGGFTTICSATCSVICGVDINSPFVHASEMALPPVLPADEPFADKKNIDKAKEWLRKEDWRKRIQKQARLILELRVRVKKKALEALKEFLGEMNTGAVFERDCLFGHLFWHPFWHWFTERREKPPPNRISTAWITPETPSFCRAPTYCLRVAG